MTELFTASWRALWQADKAGALDVRPVRISRGAPKFWPQAETFPAVDALMPEPWMLGIKDVERFGRAYRRKLHTIGLVSIQAQLDKLGGDDPRPLALACFEEDAATCHRGPTFGFAGWYEKQSGVVVPEWTADPATTPHDISGRARHDDAQLSLGDTGEDL